LADLGITRDQFIDFGRQTQPWGETFVMPVLALKLSNHAKPYLNCTAVLAPHVELPLA
jgi:hypothetical protein